MSGETLGSYFIFLLILIPTALYALLPLKNALRYPPTKTTIIETIVLSVVTLCFSLIGAAFELPMKWILIVALIPCCGLHLWLAQGTLLKKLFCFFNSTMISGNGIVYGMLLAAPLETDDSFMIMEPLTSLICLGISLLLGAIYFKTLFIKMPYLVSSDSVNLNYRFALFITAGITVIFFWVMPNYVSVVLTGRVRITILAFLILGPLAFLLVYHTMWRVAVNLTENARLRESNELMAIEQKRYEELRAYMDETRSLRHDFRQHLLVIGDYARKGETERLIDYIGQFTESLEGHRSILAANPALDAVASHYDSIAKAQETTLNLKIELPAQLPVKESDFITIFGNLVENAVQAVQELPRNKRHVTIHAKMLSDAMLGLTVSNPYAGTIEFNKDGLPTTQRPEHGVGLPSVKSIVDRHKGTLSIDTENNIFSASVLLYSDILR